MACAIEDRGEKALKSWVRFALYWPSAADEQKKHPRPDSKEKGESILSNFGTAIQVLKKEYAAIAYTKARRGKAKRNHFKNSFFWSLIAEVTRSSRDLWANSPWADKILP